MSQRSVHLDLNRREGGIAMAIPQPLRLNGESAREPRYNTRDDGGRLHEVIATRPRSMSVIKGRRHVVAGRPSLGRKMSRDGWRFGWLLLLYYGEKLGLRRMTGNHKGGKSKGLDCVLRGLPFTPEWAEIYMYPLQGTKENKKGRHVPRYNSITVTAPFSLAVGGH